MGRVGGANGGAPPAPPDGGGDGKKPEGAGEKKELTQEDYDALPEDQKKDYKYDEKLDRWVLDESHIKD